MMNWYRVWIVVPGTDGDAENGPCEPTWWNNMVQAENDQKAMDKANFIERTEWLECLSAYGECPVCTGVEKVTDEEYEEWKKEIESIPEPPFV